LDHNERTAGPHERRVEISQVAAASVVARVSTIELFFDLVFVFTVTQLTDLVDSAQGPLDFLRALLVLLVIWWMYDGYAWLMNDAGAHPYMRVVLIIAMLGFLVMTLSIPRIFSDTGLTFGLGYVFIVVLHLVAFAAQGDVPQNAVLGLAPFNLGAAAAVIIAGLVDSSWKWLFFMAAVGLFILTALVRRERQFSIKASHFVERHRQVILIALGESVAIGAGAAERALDAWTVAAMTLSLILLAGLWWAYFDSEDERAERALGVAIPEARSRMALLGYGYAHPLMISGILLLATGIRRVLTPGGWASGSAWLVAIGTSVYFLGDVAFRQVVRIQPVIVRAMGVVIALPMGLVGLTWGGVAEIGALTVLIAAPLIIEHRLEQGEAGNPAGSSRY